MPNLDISIQSPSVIIFNIGVFFSTMCAILCRYFLLVV